MKDNMFYVFLTIMIILIILLDFMLSIYYLICHNYLSAFISIITVVIISVSFYLMRQKYK